MKRAEGHRRIVGMGQKGRGMSMRRRGEEVMAGSQDSEKRQPRVSQLGQREGPVQGQVPGEKCSRARCWGRGREREVGEGASIQPGCQKEEEGGQRVEVER